MNSSHRSVTSASPLILVVGEYGVLNGGERSFLAVCRRLLKRGWRFNAAVPEGTEFAAALADIGVTNLGLANVDATGQRLNQSQRREQLKLRIQQSQPNLLHANSLSMSRLCGPVTAAMSLPAIGYLRDIMKLSKRAVADVNSLDRIVAVSNATADWHRQQGIQANRLVTIYNGVDRRSFRPLDASADSPAQIRLSQELGLGQQHDPILFVGQIGMRKGIMALAETFLQVHQRRPNARLLIVGQRNSTKTEAIKYEQDIRQRFSGSNAADSVQWLGRRSDVGELMRRAKVLLHPARQEPLGRVLLEASASALPIVTTNVGGSPEILPSEAKLFAPDDIDGMRYHICRLLNDEPLRQKIGHAQRRRAEQIFTVDRCASQLESVYKELINVKTVGHSPLL